MKKIGLFLLSIIGGFSGAYLFRALPTTSTNDTQWVHNTQPAYHASLPQISVPRSFNNATPDFVSASAKALPCVVYINCTAQGVENFSYWNMLFGNPQQSTQTSSGSGVIFSSDGYLVTNNHVVGNAEVIEVLYNRQSFIAELIGTDPSTDLAVLKINAKNLPAVTLGNSSALQVGEWVLAVGNPFSLASTVTAGIVSAKGRKINIVQDKFPIESFIQTDAAINPGNSGGALINTRGELVGINTAILSKTGSYTGYAFAVPIDIAKKVVQDLIKYGVVQKVFFGGTVVDNDFRNAEKFGLPHDNYQGVILNQLFPKGAADKAGLREGDILLTLDQKVIADESVFEEELSYRSPGEKISITYLRSGKNQTASVTLLNREGNTNLIKRKIFSDEKLGASMESVELGVKVFKLKNGILKQIGVSENFIIHAINRQLVKTPEDIVNFFNGYTGPGVIHGMNSAGQELYIRFRFN